MSYRDLLIRYKRKHGNFVEPVQGFHSLDESLWLAYSMGRRRGFTDLGTYANKPGDHGRWPALAFDLGRRDRFRFLGWNYLIARRFVKLLVKHHQALNVNYVILGDRIWSRSRGWHRYTRDRSHDFHIHCSGVS